MKTFNLYRIILTLLTLSVLFSACSKSGDAPGDGDSSGYYIKCKIDGVENLFNVEALGSANVHNTSDTVNVTSLSAGKEEFQYDTSAFAIIMSSHDPLVTGVTYTNFTTSTSNEQRIKLDFITYFDNAGVFYSSWGDEFAFAGVVSDTRIKFTEINDNYLKGTFSGTMYQEIDGSSPKHVVTTGEFYVKRF